MHIEIKESATPTKMEKYLLAFKISCLPILYPTKVVDAC
jgi:hypothetical protein